MSKAGKFTRATDRSGNPVKNLWMRNGVYYLRASIAGTAHTIRSPHEGITATRDWVKRQMTDWRTEANGGELTAPTAEVRKRPGAVPTIGDLIENYLNASALEFKARMTPRPSTVHHNICQLRNLLRKVNGGKLSNAKIDALPMSVLTAKMATKFLADAQDGLADQHIELKRARVTATQTLMQARSLVGRKMTPHYIEFGFVMPDCITGFCAAIKTEEQTRYTLPSKTLRDKTAREAVKLKEIHDPMYCAYLLCYDLGMRKGEAEAAKWDWIEDLDAPEGDLVAYMKITTRDDWKGAKNMRTRSIPVMRSTYDDLLKYKRAGCPFILPSSEAVKRKAKTAGERGETKTGRANLIKRDLSDWMTGIGWTRQRKAHELRKLAGSRWYTDAGLKWAARWLGDSTTVTYNSYTDLDRSGPQVAMR